MYNILLACDSNYYNQWTKNCIRSIQNFVPWIDITVIIVNPDKIDEISDVRYIYDYIIFENEKSKISYYQAVRFLKCADIFPNSELVMSIDCDTLLTDSFSKENFKSVCRIIHVQRHQKDKRWMAGLVTYGDDNNFRNRFKEKLLEIPIENWPWGHDQTVLNKLSEEFDYNKLFVGDWMSFGRGRGKFLTLKGDQKTGSSYLEIYNNIINGIS
jgi:hypothetical protein